MEIKDIAQYEDTDSELSKYTITILQQEIERLKNINEEHRILNGKLRVENSRSNNIINELEKWLEERLDKLDINGYDDDVFNGIELALYKLQELKGSDKE